MLTSWCCFTHDEEISFSAHGRFPPQKYIYELVPLKWLIDFCICTQNLPEKMKTLVVHLRTQNCGCWTRALMPDKLCWQFTNRQVSKIHLLHLSKIKNVVEISFSRSKFSSKSPCNSGNGRPNAREFSREVRLFGAKLKPCLISEMFEYVSSVFAFSRK